MIRFSLLLLALIPAFTFGHETTDKSNFNIDPDLANEIYQSVLESQPEKAIPIEIQVHGAILSPSKLVLSNQYFIVDYSQNETVVPGARIGIRFPLQQSGRWGIDTSATIGYGYRESNLKLTTQGGSSRTGVVRLHWAPIEASISGHVALVRWMRLNLQAGLGVHYFYQSGSLDGVSQGFWIPLIQGGPSFELFRNSGILSVELGMKWTQHFSGTPLSGAGFFGGVNIQI